MNGLLITIGDSWTYGQGSSNGFSWADYLARDLNYQLINLGIKKNSNSGAVKTLLKKDYENLKEKYSDVIIIFLLTDPIRFSFFSGGTIENFSVNHRHDFFKWYVNEVVKDLDLDPVMETVFFLRIVEYFCKLYDYKFYYASAFRDIEDINVVYKTNGLLLDTGSFAESVLDKNIEFAPCGHANDLGYQKISNFILNKIS